MAKGTRYGGMSHTPAELADPDLPVRIKRAEIGYVDRQEVEPSVGMGSSQSSENENSQSDSESQSPPLPAHTTESLSDPREAGTVSTAHTTVGVGPRKTARPSGSTAKRARATKSVETADVDFDDFA